MKTEGKVTYSDELDEELRVILIEYREGKIGSGEMLKLINIACKDHFEFNREANGEEKPKHS